MSTTHLIAELLVIGIGAACWLALAIAAALGYKLEYGVPRLDAAYLILLSAVAYVLGIVVDRLARSLLNPIEDSQRRKIFGALSAAEVESLERYVLTHSEPLARQIQYNRSRLRICRAWLINTLLILVAYLAWYWRTRVASLDLTLLFTGGIALALLLLGLTVWSLMRDHYINVLRSHEFLIKHETDA